MKRTKPIQRNNTLYFVPAYLEEGDKCWDHLKAFHRDFDKSYYDYDFYLSGGMTGITDHNFPMFNHFTTMMRRHGFRVFNPAENFGGDKNKDLSTYMRKDHRKVTECGNIILLPSFRTSKGAQAELATALSIPDMGIYNITLSVEDSKMDFLITKYR